MADSSAPALSAFTQHAHDVAAGHKSEVVTARGADAPMPFVVVGNRGSEHVVTLLPYNRDPTLWAVRMAVGGFGCDLVAVTVDAYIVSAGRGGVRGARVIGEFELAQLLAGVNPDTGREWAPGDMQRAFGRRPWIRENLMTIGLDRVSRQLAAVNQSYRAKHRKPVRWDEPLVTDSEQSEGFGGLVFDALREALEAPDVLAVLHRIAGGEAFGLSALERRGHADCVALRACFANDVVAMYNVSDPDLRGIVEMSLGDEERNAAMGAEGLHVRHVIGGLS